jgi:hypothetical protein
MVRGVQSRRPTPSGGVLDTMPERRAAPPRTNPAPLTGPTAAPSSRPPLTPVATPPRELTFNELFERQVLIRLWCEGAEVSMVRRVRRVRRRRSGGARQPTGIARAKRRRPARAGNPAAGANGRTPAAGANGGTPAPGASGGTPAAGGVSPGANGGGVVGRNLLSRGGRVRDVWVVSLKASCGRWASGTGLARGRGPRGGTAGRGLRGAGLRGFGPWELGAESRPGRESLGTPVS